MKAYQNPQEGSLFSPQRCVILIDGSSRMAGAPVEALNEGLRYFQRALQDEPDLSLSLELAVVVYGQGTQVVRAPQLAISGALPQIQAMGNATPLAGLRTLEPLLQPNNPSPTWIITLCGPGAHEKSTGLVHQMEELEWAVKLAAHPTLTVCLDGSVPAFLPPGEQAFQLKELRFVQFFDWLVEAMNFRLLCQDDLPYTTTYSWAHVNPLSHQAP